jgi:hypothetical protein
LNKLRLDFIGRFFAIMADRRSEYIDIRYAIAAPANKKIAWTTISHSRADGIAGLTEFLDQNGLTGAYDGVRAKRQPPGFLKKIFYLIRSLADRGPYNFPATARFRHLAEKFSGDHAPIASAHVIFTAAETEQITAKSRSQGVSVNSYLLGVINRLAQDSMTTPDGPLIWFIPVDLRPWLPNWPQQGNVVSKLIVPLPPDASARDIHEQITSQIDRGAHWHSWEKLRLASRLGLFERLAKRPRKTEFSLHAGKKLCFIFSNLGKWRVRRSASGKAVHPVLFCPPPNISAPASIGAVTVNGRLSLTLQVHPAIKINSVELQRVLHEIRRTLKAD